MTIRYLCEGDLATDSTCTNGVDFNKHAKLSPGDESAMLASIPTLTTRISHAFSTEANNPNVADWPNGDYTMQVRINKFAVTDFQLRIVRLNSGCTFQVQLGQSGNLTGTGTHTFTVNTDPASGAAGDLFEGRVRANNQNAMTKDLRVIPSLADPDDTFIEGPWVVASTRSRIHAA